MLSINGLINTGITLVTAFAAFTVVTAFAAFTGFAAFTLVTAFTAFTVVTAFAAFTGFAGFAGFAVILVGIPAFSTTTAIGGAAFVELPAIHVMGSITARASQVMTVDLRSANLTTSPAFFSFVLPSLEKLFARDLQKRGRLYLILFDLRSFGLLLRQDLYIRWSY